MIHFVDDHWDILERVRATTGNPAARLALNDQLNKEIRG
jgi:hypothetical protein